MLSASKYRGLSVFFLLNLTAKNWEIAISYMELFVENTKKWEYFIARRTAWRYVLPHDTIAMSSTTVQWHKKMFWSRGLRINNSVPSLPKFRGSRRSGGMLPQEILHFHIFLERFWCILSISVDKDLLRISETYFYIPFCCAKVHSDHDIPNKSLLIQNT